MSLSSLNPLDREYRESRETYREWQKCVADYQPIWLQPVADFHNLREGEYDEVYDETEYARCQLLKEQKDFREAPRRMFPLATIGMSDEWLLSQAQAGPGGNLSQLFTLLVTMEKQRRNTLFLVIVAIVVIMIIS